MSTMVEKIRAVCKEKGVKITKLEKDLGFSNGYLNPKKIETIPYERASMIAAYLGIDLNIIFPTAQPATPYYLDDEVRQIAEELAKNKDLKILFDTTRKVSAEDLKVVIEIIKRFEKYGN